MDNSIFRFKKTIMGMGEGEVLVLFGKKKKRLWIGVRETHWGRITHLFNVLEDLKT